MSPNSLVLFFYISNETEFVTMARGEILGLIFAAICLSSVSATLKIAAFNIQTMGKSKMGKPEVVNVLKQVNIFLV